LVPSALSIYQPLVKCHRELKDLNITGWKTLISSIKAGIKKEAGSLSKKPLEDGVISLGADVYWALHDAYDSIKEHEEAWKYLEIAHKVALATREKASDVPTMLEQLKQVKSVFTRSFFSSNLKGSDSKVPVFIVGMMR
jgi:hypothetical protein